MATTATTPSSFAFLKSPSHNNTTTFTRYQIRATFKPIFTTIKAQTDVRKEHVVIVGGGIAGLATALSLHRLGIRSLVLEQAESLRTGGSSLTLSKNGWSVLDAIGVADDLRTQYLEIQGIVLKAEDGKELRAFNFKQEDVSQELRAVERKVLLETLAGQLPQDTIQYSSKLAKIEANQKGDTLLELVGGTKLLAQIVIGCDGIRSPIAKWMGFPEPNYVGYCAFRGLASFSNGHTYEPRVNYIYGKGMRVGYVPISPTKVYWFICFNSSSPGPKITDTSVLKKQAKELVGNWSPEILNIIDSTPDDTLTRTPLVDRWLWPAITPPVSTGRVALVGDASHPMTPNLGQGACCALEDAVVLAKKLAVAIKSNDNPSVEEAFRSYGTERWPRLFPLTIRANFVGSVLQWDNSLVCSLRNNIVIPKLVKLGPLLEHTNFTCERL